MVGDHLTKKARRVVAGVNEQGESLIVSDGDTETRVATEAFTINQIWRMDALPPKVMEEDASTGAVTIDPPLGGWIYLLTTFPPDSEWDMVGHYARALAESGNADAHVDDSGKVGMHATDTVDVITVISGELHAVMDHGEVRLGPGESFVQRGTKHAWSNRGDVPATVVAVMAGARR